MPEYTLKLIGKCWKEGDQYVIRCEQLQAATSGGTLDEAFSNMEELVEIHLEEAIAGGYLPNSPRGSDLSRSPRMHYHCRTSHWI